MPRAYYNEHDPFAAAWLRNLIAEGLIADGDVDERSIVDVTPGDVAGYTQCHWFAGIGGWSHALRLAGWPDDKPVWTGSPPCQPFSVAGKQRAQDDARHLWPDLAGIIRVCRPPVFVGEQVANAIGKDWLDGVSLDLETIGYGVGAAVLPACGVGAPHKRERLYFVARLVADAPGEQRALVRAESRERAEAAGAGAADGAGGRGGRERDRDVADADRIGPQRIRSFDGTGRRQGSDVRPTGLRDGAGLRGDGSDVADAYGRRGDIGADDEIGRPLGRAAAERTREVHRGGFWDDHEWIVGPDGKARRTQPGIRLLAHGFPNRVGLLRGFGNAIVPPLAAEVIGALMDVESVETV